MPGMEICHENSISRRMNNEFGENHETRERDRKLQTRIAWGEIKNFDNFPGICSQTPQ